MDRQHDVQLSMDRQHDVQLSMDRQHDGQLSMDRQHDMSSSRLKHNIIGFGLQSPKSRSREGESKQPRTDGNMTHGKILYDYTAVKEDEVSVIKGEIVQILATNQYNMFLIHRPANMASPAAEGWVPSYVIGPRDGEGSLKKSTWQMFKLKKPVFKSEKSRTFDFVSPISTDRKSRTLPRTKEGMSKVSYCIHVPVMQFVQKKLSPPFEVNIVYTQSRELSSRHGPFLHLACPCAGQSLFSEPPGSHKMILSCSGQKISPGFQEITAPVFSHTCDDLDMLLYSNFASNGKQVKYIYKEEGQKLDQLTPS
ncbi:hypothetical protein CHS0354_005771 [Potamilus streckersoni]|uniref:SH3 domain-containing protein n=1 Tax=Potamilus streckersoni TaxID=2493646 RepID=A0AAE0SMW0_9BIVA|nr:hypothetical protein CHS0354_005771 [Potamilus streckersoni]